MADLGIASQHFGMLTALAAIEPSSQQRLATALGVSGPAIVQTMSPLGTSGLSPRF